MLRSTDDFSRPHYREKRDQNVTCSQHTTELEIDGSVYLKIEYTTTVLCTVQNDGSITTRKKWKTIFLQDKNFNYPSSTVLEGFFPVKKTLVLSQNARLSSEKMDKEE